MADDALAIITAGLVFVTMIYAYFTLKLARETQRERQTRWIEHQLRDLYYPLQNSITDIFSLRRCTHELGNMLYLVDREFENVLGRFSKFDISETLGEGLYGHGKDNRLAEEELLKIKPLLEAQIKELKSKLDELNA